MRYFICVLIALFALSCEKQQTKIIDEEHHSFFINGVSAIDGYEVVSKSLKDIGFVIDKDGAQKSDLTFIGKGFTYYVNYYADGLTKAQASKLTAGLFDNLPSKVIYDEAWKWRVFLSWYKTGEVNKCRITCENDMPLLDDDAVEVNKRLSAMFPHSKVGNSSYGYKIYYDDNAIELYYTNTYALDIEKK